MWRRSAAPIQPSHPSWVFWRQTAPTGQKGPAGGQREQDEKVLMASWSPTSFVIVGETRASSRSACTLFVSVVPRLAARAVYRPPAGTAGRFSPAAFGTRRMCWSCRAYRVRRGKGRRPALAYGLVNVPRQLKAAAGSSLDAVNLTRWPFCFRRQAHNWRGGVVTYWRHGSG
jgi:hypothetical protein